MGWWHATEDGGIDFLKGAVKAREADAGANLVVVNAIEDDGPILGDSPADSVTIALQQVYAAYAERWGRAPTKEELRLLLVFCGWVDGGKV
jgi:hypothetical protein